MCIVYKIIDDIFTIDEETLKREFKKNPTITNYLLHLLRPQLIDQDLIEMCKGELDDDSYFRDDYDTRMAVKDHYSKFYPDEHVFSPAVEAVITKNHQHVAWSRLSAIYFRCLSSDFIEKHFNRIDWEIVFHIHRNHLKNIIDNLPDSVFVELQLTNQLPNY